MPLEPMDDAQWRELIPRLRRFALWLCRDQASADDLVQATLERALSRGEQRRETGDPRPWLFAILYRQFIDAQRRARRQARWLSWFGADEPASPGPEDAVLAQAGLAAFADLPAEQRALLVLVSVEGLSYKQAAEALQLPIGTVMSRLSRARAALRQLTEGQVSAPIVRRLK